MIAAALGLKRDADIAHLSALKFGVRTDQKGKLVRDYHTVRKDEKTSYVTTRYYLSDAVFLVGLESDDVQLLETLDKAIRSPYYPLFLGRRSCPPEGRVSLGIRELSLREALESEPWLAPVWRQRNLDKTLFISLEAQPEQNSAIIRDVPVSFSPVHRQFAFRAVQQYSISIEDGICPQKEHDPMAELR